MKNTTKLLTIVSIVVALIAVMMISCTAANIDCKIYTPEQIQNGFTVNFGAKMELIAASDTDPEHIHLSRAGDTTAYLQVNFHERGVTDQTFVPTIKVEDYPIAVISYRSNLATKENVLAINAGLKLSTTGKFERCWRLRDDLVNDEQWHKAIYDITLFENYSGGEASYNDVVPGSGIKYLRASIWDNADKASIKGTYFDIDYIGFFKTVADAEAYGRGADVIEEVVVQFKAEDGAHVSKKTQAKGTVIALPTDPQVQGKKFVGWKNSAGEIITENFKAEANDTLYAVHEYTEEGLAELKRIEEAAKALAAATSQYKYIGYLVDNVNTATANKFTMTDIVMEEYNLPAKRLAAQTPNQAYDTSTYGLFTLDGSFLAKDFPIVVLGYRTNIATSKEIAVSFNLSRNGKYDRFWGVRAALKKTEKLENAIFDLRNLSASNFGSNIGFEGVDDISNVGNIRINPWNNLKGTIMKAEDYFDIAYVAFFRTREDAENFEYKEGCFDREVIADRVDAPFIKGYDNYLFKPENNMTRAEACTVVTRLLVDEATIKGKYTSKFTDLEKGAWYYDNIAYLESLGYLKNYSGKFEPNKNITRAEFVELVYAMGKVQANPDNKLTFSDVPTTHPRYEVIMAGASAGLVSGRPGGIFDPDGTIKRSEVVKVLCNALGRTPNLDLVSKSVTYGGFADVTRNHWAYAYVIEAAYEHKVSLNDKGEEIWLEVIDNNKYMTQAPSNIEAELDKKFEERKTDILNTKSEWTVAPGGTVWYISESTGNDSNDGKSPETAWKSMAKLNREVNNKTIKKGDVVLLKRGDIWRSKVDISGGNGFTLSAYGEGEKPKIYGSINGADPAKWLATDKPNLYKFDQTININSDVAGIFFNEGKAWAFRVLIENGKMIECGDDGLVSNGLKQWVYKSEEMKDQNDLKYDLTFYHNWDEKALYLYCEGGNPAERFDSIEISTDGHAIIAGSDTIIDNICIKFTGRHGISGKSPSNNLIVRNCELGFIGGAVQNPDNGMGRLGNAVEVYGVATNFKVYNNFMHNTFDCGPTVQVGATLTPGKSIVEQNIEFYDNVLWDADLEVWLTTKQENTADMYAGIVNCRIYNNMVTASGYGFSGYFHYKHDYVSFYGALETKAEMIDCYIENNYFWGARKNLLRAIPTSSVNGKGFHWRNNTIVKPYGSPIGQLGSDTKNAKGGQTLYMYKEDTIKKLLCDGAFGFNKFYYTGTAN